MTRRTLENTIKLTITMCNRSVKVWICKQDGKYTVNSVWLNGGNWNVKIPDELKLGVTLIDELIIAFENYFTENIGWCSRCSNELHANDIAGNHFAGVFCKECWELYKKEHARRCLMCGRPEYECVC